jgi:hypothetical protein
MSVESLSRVVISSLSSYVNAWRSNISDVTWIPRNVEWEILHWKIC